MVLWADTFNNYFHPHVAQAAVVPLSSIRQPAWLIGYTAVDLLLREARHGAESVPDQVQFQPELIVRESTRARS